MRVVVLGSTGMLGSMVTRVLNNTRDLTLLSVSRKILPSNFCKSEKKAINHIILPDFFDTKLIRSLLDSFMPDVIINCVGHVKQRDQSDSMGLIKLNSLFPLILKDISLQLNCRLIHFSTDCVFSGLNGPYSPICDPDPRDIYGITKMLGEISGQNTLTLRTSIIGPELNNSSQGLLEWAKSKAGQTIYGYTKAFFSGFTTLSRKCLGRSNTA